MEKDRIVIKPKSKWKLIDIDEVLRYKELFYIFAWRDIKVRYKQTILGILWVILQPIATMVIFTIFFGKLAKIPSGKLPYSLFVLCGLVFWNFFSNSLSHASNSMVENDAIIKKVYFPKVILPVSSIVVSFVDFSINFIILLLFAALLGFAPSAWLVIVLPAALILTSITAAGLGLILSSLNVKYRDIRYILPFSIQILLFLTPVIYSLNIVDPANRYILALNPLTAVIESIRTVFSGGTFLDFRLMAVSTFAAVASLLAGLWYFRKTENFFADIV